MASIDLANVSKRYENGVKAVQDLTLSIRDKEFMVLVGPSGCGKSTTLRMIAGLESVSTGEIHLGERCINTVPPKDRDLAMVFQNYALYPHMTVFQNMAFALKLRKIKRDVIATRVGDAAQMLGLTAQLDTRPRELSGGQRQRVALGRAVVRNPQAFLFDEPLSNLDAKLRADMRFELRTLQQRLATTMVYVTHDQVEAMTLGDRIAVLHEGRLQQVAPPVELYDRPVNRFVARFIGTPEMNLLAGRVVKGEEGLAMELPGDLKVPIALPMTEALAQALAAPEAPRSFGIRPEHLADARYTPIPAGASTLEMEVRVVESLGDHQYIYLGRPGSPEVLIMKNNAHHRAAPGEHITVWLDTARGHIFDGIDESAVNLTLSSPSPKREGIESTPLPASG